MSDNYTFCTPILSNELSEYKNLFIKYGNRSSYISNTIVFETGDLVDSIYYIDKGRVKLSTTNYEGKEKILFFLGEGTIFGAELSLSSEISMTTATTESPSVLYVTSPTIINSSAEFKDSVIKYMSKTIITLMRSIESLSLYCCKTRLYNLLRSSVNDLSSEEENWHDLKYQYSQEDLAKVINANRVTVARMINELCQEELIRIINRKIQVKV